jgi:hypothetical protein
VSSSRDRSAEGRRWSVRLIIAFAIEVVVVVSMLAALAVHAPDHLPRVEAFVKAAKPWAVGVQLLIVGLVWLRWPRIVYWLAARGRIRAAEVGPLLRARHRVMTLLLVMVLTLSAGLPFSLLASLHGG